MYSFSEIGRRLGIDHHTVTDLIDANQVPVFRHPSNARAKAVDEAGFQTVKAAWERAKPVTPASPARPRRQPAGAH